MEQMKIIIVSNNKTWCREFNEKHLRYDSLELIHIVSDYVELNEMNTELTPDIIIADLDLLIASGLSYENVNNLITSWEPKLPFVIAIGDGDHRAINKAKMRYGVDFWNNKTPEEDSVEDVLHILDECVPFLLEAKRRAIK